MAKEIIMPKFEMAQETGTVAQWLKNEGDLVEKGEAILEVETDKVTMEVESPAAGILAGISAEPDAVIPIGQIIAYILKPGEALPQSDALQPASTTPVDASTTQATPQQSAMRATPLAQRVAESHGIDLQSVAPTGYGDRITKVDIERHIGSQQPALSEKMRAVPAARRLARELGVDLQEVKGCGPNGRIQSVDVRLAVERVAEAISAPAATLYGREIRRTVPLTKMRRAIASRMAASVREAPQFTVSMDVVMGRAMEMVDDLRSTAAPDEPKMTITSLLVKACAWALQRHPQVNASFEENALLEWADINIGVATAVEDGLLVPVIHRANMLTVREIGARLADLSNRKDQLRSENLQGGTFTISNLGMFGVERFTAILNPPEAAILAVGRAAKRAMVTPDDQIEVQLMADFTLTVDHRVIDGALAGRFLADLKQVIERPGGLL